MAGGYVELSAHILDGLCNRFLRSVWWVIHEIMIRETAVQSSPYPAAGTHQRIFNMDCALAFADRKCGIPEMQRSTGTDCVLPGLQFSVARNQ